MKYKAGDRVRIRSKEWYESHKNKFGKIWTVCLSGEGTICFDQDNAKYCGKEVTIFSVEPDNYVLRGIPYEWTDEMIEGLVEEEIYTVLNIYKDGYIHGGNVVGNEITLPQGYQFKDENGNVINATKIVLEKKKKEYPKTYEECINELDIHNTVATCAWEKEMKALQTLLVCRDAYWKIAGEKMGLGKPWEPDWDDDEWPDMYYIRFDGKCLEKEKGYPCCNMILIFPTEEMRDAFYENFKVEIESCKELL